MNELVKIFRSFKNGFKGLCHAYRVDKSFRMELQYGLPIYLALAWILAPFTSLEFLLFAFSYLLILLVELINTAFEKMLDKLHPEEHELIGKSKDIASGAVFVAFLFALIVVVTLIVSRVEGGGSVLIQHTFV